MPEKLALGVDQFGGSGSVRLCHFSAYEDVRRCLHSPIVCLLSSLDWKTASISEAFWGGRSVVRSQARISHGMNLCVWEGTDEPETEIVALMQQSKNVVV